MPKCISGFEKKAGADKFLKKTMEGVEQIKKKHAATTSPPRCTGLAADLEKLELCAQDQVRRRRAKGRRPRRRRGSEGRPRARAVPQRERQREEVNISSDCLYFRYLRHTWMHSATAVVPSAHPQNSYMRAKASSSLSPAGGWSMRNGVSQLPLSKMRSGKSSAVSAVPRGVRLEEELVRVARLFDERGVVGPVVQELDRLRQVIIPAPRVDDNLVVRAASCPRVRKSAKSSVRHGFPPHSHVPSVPSSGSGRWPALVKLQYSSGALPGTNSVSVRM